ncbi:MAG TPA: NAD-dependent epimerase/dehydratase family protein [Solirubrobacterales bacterium]|jgi:nucleoside-diphosphate-sugar epimerase
MRIAVTGASGNVGTSALAALSADDRVDSILGIARRRPKLELPKVEWATADVRSADLAELFEGADAVIHLAWLIQPSRDERETESVNVTGSERVFGAVADAAVPRLVYASSVGAYSPGPKDRLVDESHPTDGIETSFYSRHKATVERILDRFESSTPSVSVTRLRPGLIFKGEAASEIRRLFAGPFLPNFLVDRRLIPVVPDVPGLRFQAVHSLDVGEAYRLAVFSEASGAFNVAADPVLDPERLARLLGARRVRAPAALVRGLTSATWNLRLQPTSPGWLDMALKVPLMSSDRARSELGWMPQRTSEEALLELIEGLRRRRGLPTPPLDPGAGGPLRVREIGTGVGAR